MSTDHDIGYGWTHKQEDGERETEVVRCLYTLKPQCRTHWGLFIPKQLYSEVKQKKFALKWMSFIWSVHNCNLISTY